MVRLFFCFILLFSSCDFFRGYDPKLLPKEYSEAFREIRKIKPVPDSPFFNNGDYWQTPLETLKRKAGDCEDLAFLLEYKLKQRDLNVIVKFGKSHISSKDNHAWCEATNKNGDRIVMDPFFGIWSKNPKKDFFIAYEELPLAIIIKMIDYEIRLKEESGEIL